VLTDIGLQSIQTKTYGDDTKGYRIVVQTPGQRNSSYFFVKENDQYKLLDTSDQPNALALEVLDRVERNDLDGASQLLEWLRDGQSFENGDDKFAGNPFTRYWLSGHRQPDALRIKVAAAMILAQQQQTATQGMALLESLKGSVTDNADSELIDLAITVGSAVIFDYEKALTYSRLLSQHSSTSRRAFLIQSWSLRGLKRYDEAMALAQQRLQENSSDIDAQRMIAETLSSSGRYQDAYHQIQKVIENSNAGAGDFNNLSWTTLFFDNSEALDVSGATRATQLSENSPSTLHTLGSIYAEQGKIVEAHDVMFHLLDSARLDQPEDNTWFILARIAEYAGEPTIAMEYYKLVSKPKDIVVIPTSTDQLAQRRLQYLSAHKPTGSASIH
jgi:tetratricopeptide (TPR) repeat protein